MKVEDLLKTLRDAGLKDDEIKALLEEALKSLNGPVKEDEIPNPEDKEAGKLLGVAF